MSVIFIPEEQHQVAFLTPENKQYTKMTFKLANKLHFNL